MPSASVYYRIANPNVYALCDLVCDNIAKQLERSAEARQALFSRGSSQKTENQER